MLNVIEDYRDGPIHFHIHDPKAHYIFPVEVGISQRCEEKVKVGSDRANTSLACVVSSGYLSEASLGLQ